MRVGGGPVKQKHGGCVAAPGKTAGTEPPLPQYLLVSCRCQLMNHCSFLFLLQFSDLVHVLVKLSS